MKEEIAVEKKVVEESGVSRLKTFDKSFWTPKTTMGRKVKSGEITNIDTILDSGSKILEAEIVDALVPNLESDLLAIGQSKGKFGGGKRSIWRQTQKKSMEGSKISFTAMVIIGNKDGYVGLGTGKAKETVPAREKAIRNAKLNLVKVRRGCGSWACGCKDAHSIPFEVEGKCGSVIIKLKPAPKGSALIAQKECKKILHLAGIKDIYTKTMGQTTTRYNFMSACFNALKELVKYKVKEEEIKTRCIVAGRLNP